VPLLRTKSSECPRAELGQDQVILDSNYRYFNGAWLGLGLALLGTVPAIERQGPALRLIALMIFVGALGRLASIIDVGAPTVLSFCSRRSKCYFRW
jgi:hypothetical protein